MIVITLNKTRVSVAGTGFFIGAFIIFEIVYKL